MPVTGTGQGGTSARTHEGKPGLPRGRSRQPTFARVFYIHMPTACPRAVNRLDAAIGNADPMPAAEVPLAGEPAVSGESVLVGIGDGLGSVTDAGFGEHVVDVALHRGFTDHQPTGDLGVGQPLSDE